MLIRIWWKEWRSLAPILATLLVAAGALHAFLLSYGGRDIRNGTLIVVAEGFAVVYALVAGAAAFAGERENRTLGFLDALPVGRGMLWVGKASFALVSSVALALFLRWGSTLGWTFQEAPFTPIIQVDLFFGLLLVEAAVWGLFGSAVSTSALTAGIIAVLATGGTAITQAIIFPHLPTQGFGGVDVASTLWRGTLMVVPLAVSWIIINQGLAPLPRFDSGHARSAGGSVRNLLTRRIDSPFSIAFHPSPAFWSVAWQTVHEGRTTWLQTLGIGLVVPILSLLMGVPGLENPFLVICCVLALLIQGSSVFGLENSAGTRQFLDNQAVPPGTVWLAKVGVWGLGLVAFTVIVLAAGAIGSPWISRPGGGPPLNLAIAVLAAIFILVNAFAVGLVSGMMLTRRITGAMIAMLGLFVLVVPQIALLTARVIPLWGLLVSPLILLGVSRAWAGDWLANRSGSRRWVKLGALVAVPFAALIATHVASRAYGVADLGPQFVQGPEKPDLAGFFRAAHSAITDNPAPGVFEEMFVAESVNWAEQPDLAKVWESNREAIGLTRQCLDNLAVAGGYEVPGKGTIFDLSKAAPDSFAAYHDDLAGILAIDSVERRSRGDFNGAWDDILDQFRIVNLYAASSRSVADYQQAMILSHKVVNRALAWSRDPKMTAEAVQAARKSFETVAAVPSPADALRGESRTIEASLDHPTEDWVDFLTPSSESNTLAPWTRIYDAWVVAPAWERERTRRIVRMMGAAAIKGAGFPGWTRPTQLEYWPGTVLGSNTVTPLVERVDEPLILASKPYDREATNRSAIEVFLAVRDYQIVHGGKAPATLDALADSDTRMSFVDPYAGRQFGYINIRGKVNYFRPGLGADSAVGTSGVDRDQYLIYSVGPNHHDEQTLTPVGQAPWVDDDLIYLLPPNPPGPR